eukprot:scaffold8469_cov112-Isochrysis_galbana.AAC.4
MAAILAKLDALVLTPPRRVTTYEDLPRDIRALIIEKLRQADPRLPALKVFQKYTRARTPRLAFAMARWERWTIWGGMSLADFIRTFFENMTSYAIANQQYVRRGDRDIIRMAIDESGPRFWRTPYT